MSTWQRASLAVLFTVAAAGTARAQSPQKRASDLNDQGKTALFAQPPDYQLAADKFRQAIVLSSEGRFYFNLCLAEYQMGDFGGSLMACQAVGGSAAPADEKTKKNAADLLVKIKEQMQKQGMDPNAVPAGGNTTGGNTTGNPDGGNTTGGSTGNGTGGNTTGNPDGGNTTGGNTTGGNTTGGSTGNGTGGNMTPPPLTGGPSQFRGAPPPSLFQTATPSHDYTYTFGAALMAGSGSFGSANAYGSGVGGVRILGDLLFASSAKVGGEGYIDFMNVQGNDLSSNGSLTMVDFGVGLYKHFCSGRMCVTPMAGAHLVGYSPAMSASTNDYASLGLRLQGALGYAFGSRYEHYVTFNVGADFDAKPIGTYDDDPANYGLDKGAVMVLFSLGYQYRFNTPFGQTPFFQLE